MKIFKLWFPAIFWAGLVFYLSGIPNLRSGLECDFILRKIAHFVEYFVFTFLLHRALKGSFDMDARELFVHPATISFLYAISDEFHQAFVPGRNASVIDVFIDAVGILGFYIVIKIFNVDNKKRKRRIYHGIRR